MSYELFRNDVLLNMAEVLPTNQIVPAIHAVDDAARDYDISRKNMTLTVVNGVPNCLREYIGARATENIKPDTLRTYFYDLRNFFLCMSKDIEKITANDIRCYLYDYKQRRNVSDRTVEQIRIYINGFFDWCVREDILAKNPCDRVSPIRYYIKPREPFTVEELENIKSYCDTKLEKAVVDMLSSTGLRVSELCKLKKSDIDWTTRAVKVLHGKGDKFRITYMSAESAVSLKSYLRTRTDDCDYVIVEKRSKQKHGVEKKTIEKWVKDVCLRAGIEEERAKPHNFRHTFATILIQNGAPVQHVPKLLGHAKLETTMIYAKDNQDDIRRTHERCAV